MNEINKTNLSEQTKFRLSEIIGIENYFHQEINQRKSCSKKLSKYVTAFDYINKILFFNCSNEWSLYHFICKCCWTTSWNSKCKFYFNFCSNSRNNQKITKYNKKQKEQENAMRCNNRDNLLQLSFSLKISIFSEIYI